jgi:uncharacterized membrane protein YesL
MSNNRREFGEGPIAVISNHVYWMLLGSVYFWLCNIPLLFVLFILNIELPEIDIISLVVFIFIAMIPVGPALTALMSAMGKLVREKDVNITKDYFKAYKANFKQSIVVWLIELTVLFIVVIDMIFFNRVTGGIYFIPLLISVGVVTLGMGTYAFPIISRFYLKTRDVLRLSFLYTVKRLGITIFNITILVITMALLLMYLPLAVFFAVSVACFVIMFYQKDLLKKFEEDLENVDDEKEVSKEDR